ncbi:hypothetical protein ES703_07741 [subsurface metagenome]
MSVQNDILEVLNQRDQPVKTSELVKVLKKPSSTIRGETTRLKQKGYIEGDSQEGWVIADTGKVQFEKGDIHPTMIDEGVTPRQQFEAIGRLIGIKEDRIVLATNMVWSGDYEDVIWVFKALGREGADLAEDLRRQWANQWRAKLHKGIPPELEAELTGVKAEAGAGKGIAPSKPVGREYIIVDDEPVRVGENLGDYGLQDAKDILAIRAMRNRFSGVGQAGATSQPGAGEKVSDLLRELAPYINKGSDQDMLRELITAQMEVQKQEILSHIPQPGQPAQPKSFVEQITGFVAALGSLKEAGPMLRSILGVPESSGNPSTGLPVQIEGPAGQPIVMDLGQVIDWRKFQGDERRADERHTALVGLAQTVRENIGDGIAAIKAAAGEIKPGTGAKTPTPVPQPQTFQCGDCKTQFSPPPEWAGQPLKCPNPECGREYSKEELVE